MTRSTRAAEARVDRRHRSPRPPPRAVRGCSRISGARRVQHAAARPAATTPRAASRGRPSARGRIFDAAAEASEAARGSPPPTTTAASWGDPRLYLHLRRALRRMRRGTPHSDHMPSREPHRRVRPWPHLRRRSTGTRGRARIAAAAHHGRFLGRSAALAASPPLAAPDAPRHTPLRPHAGPRATSARLPMDASSTPQPRRERPRADRRRCPPRPPPGAIRGSSRISGARCAGCAAAHPTATAR